MKKKLFSSILAVILAFVVFSFAGCGNNNDAPSSNTYSVTYDANGGAFGDGEQSFTLENWSDNASLVEPISPVRTGYVFDGWSKSKYSIDKWQFASDTVKQNLTLYALWNEEQPATYTATFNAKGGQFYDGETSFSQTELQYGDKLLNPISPTRDGYDFIGWSIGEYVAKYWDFDTDTVTQDITLYAIWEESFTRDDGVQSYTMTQKYSNVSRNYITDLRNVPTKTLSADESEQAIASGYIQRMPELEGRKVVYKKRSAEYGIDDLSYYGANNNITYAGSMLRMNQTGTEIAPIIGIKRKPITLSIDLEGSTGVNYQRITVDTITQSTVGQAINQLVKGFTGEQAQLPYMVALRLTEIKAKEEINAALGLSFNVGSFFNFNSEFDFANKGEKTYAMLVLKQIYYTVNVDYMFEEGAFSLLDDGVTVSQLQNACGYGYCPTYVSSVSYGRIAVITIKSDKQFSEISAALSIGGGSLTKTELESEVDHISNIGGLECNWFVYGGSTSGQQDVLTGKNIKDMLQSLNYPYDPAKQVGLPITYQLSHIADNSSARIGFVGDYYFAEYCDAAPTLQDGKKDTVSQTFNVVKKVVDGDGSGTYYLNGAYSIANSSFIRVNISELDTNYIKNSGSNIEIKIVLSIKEDDDGYQEIYLYNAGVDKKRVQSGKDTPIANVEIEHGVGKKDATYKTYCLTAVVSVDSITNSELWIAFDAWGKNDDDWYAKNITITLSKTDESIHPMYAAKQ